MDAYKDDVNAELTVELNQRVQAELEILNTAADGINKLENELLAAQTKFIRDRAQYTHKLEVLIEQVGKKFVSKARPYYELVQKCQKVHADVRRSAEKYSSACSSCERAMQLLATVERQTQPVDGGCKVVLDPTRQEALNGAIEMVMAAEKEKILCEVEHQAKAVENHALQQRLTTILKDIPKAIDRARPYFSLKEQLESHLQALRQTAEDLALALRCSKDQYRAALTQLEAISDEVHEQRRLMINMLPPRTPGVGAESTDELSEWPSVIIDADRSSIQRLDADDAVSCCSSVAGDADCDRVLPSAPPPLDDGEPAATDSRLPIVLAKNEQDDRESSDATKCSDDHVSLDSLTDVRSQFAAVNLSPCHTTASFSMRTLETTEVTEPSCGCRDGQGDGAEDSSAVNLGGSFEDETSAHKRLLSSADQASVDCSMGIVSSRNSGSVAVSSLPSGIYITKTVPRGSGCLRETATIVACGNEAYMTTEAKTEDNGAMTQRLARREQRRHQLAQQFPILFNLSAANQQQLHL